MSRILSATPAGIEPPTRRRELYLAPPVLLAAGLLLAVTTNLSKVAQDHGLTSLPYLTWSLTGAALLLTVFSSIRGRAAPVDRRTVEYYLVSGFLTVAGGNLIFFGAVAHLGVGFVALTLSLPPLLTYAGALALRMESFCGWRATGVLLALAGTVFLVARRWAAPETDPLWIGLALLGPVLLAAGNIYRSHRWPPGASAEALAPGMLVGAIAFLVMISLLPGCSLALPADSTHALALIALQAVVYAGQFWLLFVLQKAGGPVFLSLMGGVSAVFSVPIATALLGEALLPGFLPSATLIAAGVACMLLGVSACARRAT